MSIIMGTHLSSVAEENKLFDGSGNVGVCENPQAGAGVGAVAGTGKKPVCVCVKAALLRAYTWLLKKKKCRRNLQARHAGSSRNSSEMEKLIVERNELQLTCM